MKKNVLTLSAVLIAVILLTGCSSLLPTSKTTIGSPWKTIDDAKENFDRILPYNTRNEDLKTLNFHPYSTDNIEILTYLDIITIFMPNESIDFKDLDPGIQECILLKELCYAYSANIQDLHTKRYGSVMLDLFGFKRKREDTGWFFKALIVLNDNLVIYKLWEGKPSIHSFHETNKPLGPFQRSESILRDMTPAPPRASF
jgi:hypothetical protein